MEGDRLRCLAVGPLPSTGTFARRNAPTWSTGNYSTSFQSGTADRGTQSRTGEQRSERGPGPIAAPAHVRARASPQPSRCSLGAHGQATARARTDKQAARRSLELLTCRRSRSTRPTHGVPAENPAARPGPPGQCTSHTNRSRGRLATRHSKGATTEAPSRPTGRARADHPIDEGVSHARFRQADHRSRARRIR